MITAEKPMLSVVVLAYRSETFLKSFVRQLHNEVNELSVAFEIIVVANYEREDDPTPQIAREIASELPSILVISKKKEGKMGWDMRSGLEKACGEYIAVIDGDGQIPVSDISTVYAIISTGKYDLVKTFRKQRFDGMYRSVMSLIYNRLFKFLFRPTIPLNDINAKPKIFTRAAYQQMNLVSNDWFTDAEIMIQAIEQKMRICQIATVFFKNERRSSFVSWETAFEFLFNLVRYRLKRPR